MQVALDCSLLNLKTDTESQQLEVAPPPPSGSWRGYGIPVAKRCG